MTWMWALGASVLLVVALLILRLRRSEARFRLLAENMSDLVGIHTPDGKHLWLSPSVERILGYKPKELVGKSAYDFIHLVSTYRAQRKDGSYVWLETLTTPILDKQGHVVRLQTASRDITDRKQAEDLYRFLVRNLPNTSVFLFDRSYRHLIAEGTITGRTLAASHSLEGLTLWEVFPEDIAGALAPYYRGVFERGPSRAEQIFRTRTYHTHFLPVNDAMGHTQLGMAVFQDVTESKAAQLALTNAIHDLERSNRDLEQFADIASHELKSPLRRIGSFAEILLEEYEGMLSVEADDYLHHINRGVEEMRSVVEALLTYSRAKSQEDRTTQVDFNKLVEDTIRRMGHRIELAKGTVVRVGSLPTLSGDPVLLRQLLENLIGNGLKFAQPKPTIRVTAHRDLLTWIFSVTDDGPGIPKGEQDRIFQMFKRARTDVEGSGIGLALCKKIVGIHRGKIWVESKPGQGTSFRFTLQARNDFASLPPMMLNDEP
jgi:signal transduction histidine kinase